MVSVVNFIALAESSCGSRASSCFAPVMAAGALVLSSQLGLGEGKVRILRRYDYVADRSQPDSPA
jgi:hypothetical protein